MPLPRLVCLTLGLPALALAAATPPPVALKDFLGLCGHTVQFKPERYEGVTSIVRDYHPVSWDLADDSATPAPLPFAKNRVDWDHVYGGWRKAGLRVHASLMFSGFPAEKWKNLETDSHAYARAFAKMAGPGGRDWMEAVEIGNEPGHYSDADYARVFDAMSKGVREGDPQLKIATCNVTAGKSSHYDKPIELFRSRLDRVDIFTVHTYAQTDGWPTWHRTFPEDPATPYLKDVRAVVAWRDAHAKGKPVWVTEFGWDAATSLEGRKGDFAKWAGNVTDTAQAAYLLRSIPLFLAEGVERAHIYFFDDKDEPQMHGAAGILRHGKPKPSWYALRQMQRLLGDARLERLDREASLYTARWRKPDGSCWLMLWTPKADSDTTTPHTITSRPLGEIIPMALTATDPATLRTAPAGTGRWSVPVGPRPVYLRVAP
ncbi:MAG: hypothetical protein K0R17_423 [Rariglobus sp.]|jgi:hypothetical protein|nr:hypothetical protein [Rariglobus sp.]